MATSLKETAEVTVIGPVSNGAEPDVASARPYRAEVTLIGVSRLLLHAWNNEAVASKAAAAKGSKAKKSDNVESYVYRDGAGHICLPGSYLHGAVIDPRNGAAKYRADPRSPRKSALDLYRAGFVVETDLAPIYAVGSDQPAKTWDMLDRRRVMVQRQGITRERPAFEVGWRATFHVLVLTPEYMPPTELLSTLSDAGRLTGIGDFRPSFGRFAAELRVLGD